MAMTMTQKILAAHAGLPEVKPGQLIKAKLDMVLGNDITSPVAINEFNKAGFEGVFDTDKISLVMDHFAPNKDIKAAQQCKQCRAFAHRFDIKNYYDVGEMGIEHALLPEKGLVGPGELIIGADSHTCTYGAPVSYTHLDCIRDRFRSYSRSAFSIWALTCSISSRSFCTLPMASFSLSHFAFIDLNLSRSSANSL